MSDDELKEKLCTICHAPFDARPISIRNAKEDFVILLYENQEPLYPDLCPVCRQRAAAALSPPPPLQGLMAW